MAFILWFNSTLHRAEKVMGDYWKNLGEVLQCKEFAGSI